MPYRSSSATSLLRLAGARSQVRHHPAPVLRVRDRRMRRDGFTRVTAGLAQHQGAAHHPRHEIDLGGFRHRLVHRARQLLALARPPAIEQRGDDGEGELLAGDVIGVPHLRRDRRQIVLAAGGRIVAAIHHDAAQREVHQVRALEVGPGPWSPNGDTRATISVGSAASARPRPTRARRARPSAWTPAARRRWRRARGTARDPSPVADRARSSACRGCTARRTASARDPPVLVEGADAARGAAAGRLHLDDVGAQPRQRQPAVLRLLVGQLDDADAGERARAGRVAVGNGTLVLSLHDVSPPLLSCDDLRRL